MHQSKRSSELWNQYQHQNRNKNQSQGSSLVARRPTMGRNKGAAAGSGALNCGLLMLLLLLQLVGERLATPSPSSMQAPQKRGRCRHIHKQKTKVPLGIPQLFCLSMLKLALNNSVFLRFIYLKLCYGRLF